MPRHSFHAWLVTLNRLPTRDRLLSWGLAVPATCLLCNQGDESRDHLFFSCSFSSELWIHHVRRIETTPSTGWNDSLSRMQSLPGPPWRRKLQLIVWQAVIYSIWQERNARLHRNTAKTVTTMSSILDRTIRNKIQVFRDSNPIGTSQLLQLWFATAPSPPPHIPLPSFLQSND